MFYFFMIVIAFYNLLLYAIFRSGIYSYLRLSKMSKTYIKKNRKGFINYWLYYSINKQNSLGILYGLNLTFIIATVAFIIFTITVGYIRALQPIMFAFSIVFVITMNGGDNHTRYFYYTKHDGKGKHYWL